jgi:Bacterial regulatory protein, Fis family/Calcineurin-like phosphoesterase
MAAPPVTREACLQIKEAIDKSGGNFSVAAQLLGIPRPTLISRYQAGLRQKFYKPVEQRIGMPVQPPPSVGIAAASSTLYDADGQVKLQWIKTKEGHDPAKWVEHIKDVFADATPIKRIAAPKGPANPKLLTVYPIGDHHVGMYSWAEETGADYDIKIAERILVSAISHLVESAPASDTALIVNLGDFFHVDNLKNATSRSGNVLDVDTRYAGMIRAGVRMLRTVIDCALTKHKKVKVMCAIGNHDDIGALWLALALEQFYDNNPRVEIETSPSKFYYHRHGKVLLGVTHGDTGKPEKMHSVMAVDRAKDWGETQHRYWLTGHVHTRKVIEFPGVMWETFRVLSPNDAWATAAGYRSGRDMTSIVFHQDHGEISRHRFDVSMLA